MKQHKLEIGIVAALLLLCAVAAFFLYAPRGGDPVAVITVDGVEYNRIDLAKAQDQVFQLEATNATPEKPVSFEVKDHQIRFVNVTCPDHICEKTGWCAQPGDRAVCMPNRVSLVCYERDEL